MEGTVVEIVDRRAVGPGTVAVTIEAPPGFDARPGQFVQVRATVDGERVTRHYSISSREVSGRLEVTVGVDPDGALSPWLAEADAGDTLEVDGPFGRVFYEGEPSVVVLASGPGIGPAVAVAERAISDGGDAAVVYRTDDLVHERRLAGLARAGAPVHVVGEQSNFRAAVARSIDRGRAFVYGFEPFVEAAEGAIEAAGGDPSRTKVENFG